MARHTQAHLPRRIKKSKGGLDAMTKQQMEYYMGAKLLEIGVDPQSEDVAYRWSAKAEGDEEVWTYSAYWGDSREKLLGESSDNASTSDSSLGKKVSPEVWSGVVIGAGLLIFAIFWIASSYIQ